MKDSENKGTTGVGMRGDAAGSPGQVEAERRGPAAGSGYVTAGPSRRLANIMSWPAPFSRPAQDSGFGFGLNLAEVRTFLFCSLAYHAPSVLMVFILGVFSGA